MALAIFVLCAFSTVASIASVYDAFHADRPALGIVNIIIAILFATVLVLMLIIRDNCANFEIDRHHDDEPVVTDLKDACGYIFAAAIIMVILTWFFRVCGIL